MLLLAINGVAAIDVDPDVVGGGGCSQGCHVEALQ